MLMKTVLAAGLVTMGAAAAAAPPAWEGRWAMNSAWCAKQSDVEDESPDYYGVDGFYGQEWGCEILNIQETGLKNSWSLKLECSLPGETWEEERLMLLTSFDRLMFVFTSGDMFDLVRCPALPE